MYSDLITGEQLGERLPPHDLDAEEAVLGSLLIDPDAIFRVVTFLQAEDFYREKNRWCYECCLALYQRNEATNQIAVAHELSRQQRLEAIGGSAYLGHLVAEVPTSVHVEHYARIVHRLSVMRKLIEAGQKIADIGYQAPPDLDESLGRAESVLYRLRSGQSTREFVHIREVLDRYFDESGFAPGEREGHLAHIPTGFYDIDKILGGLQRSDLVILAARPALGKTSLALNIARNAALSHGARTAIFSLEMSKMELAYRFLSSESGVDTQRVRLDQLNDQQRASILDAIGLLSDAPIYIDDSPLLRDSDMRSKAQRLKQEKGIDLVIVDYLQLLRSGRRTDNRVQEMSEISHSLKELARELEAPVLAVSQLSRAVELRADRKPMLSDLRESGSIEQDADVVMFISRADAHLTREEWERLHPDQLYPKGQAEIIVAKHRNGPTGLITLYFRENLTRFENFRKSEAA